MENTTSRLRFTDKQINSLKGGQGILIAAFGVPPSEAVIQPILDAESNGGVVIVTELEINRLGLGVTALHHMLEEGHVTDCPHTLEELDETLHILADALDKAEAATTGV